MKLFDYECSVCHATFEMWDAEHGPCPECRAPNPTRLISAPRLDPKLGVDPNGFPTMGAKWERRRKQHQRIEERRKREHGA